MAFQSHDWFMSAEQEVKKEFAKPVEGKQVLYIEDATYDDDKKEYKISLTSLENGAKFSLTYYLESVKDGQVVKTQWAYNVLIGLGKALAGHPIGVPFFEDIIHGLVIGNVKLEESKKNGRTYAKIYEYNPIDAQTYSDCKEAGMDLIDQHIDGAD